MTRREAQSQPIDDEEDYPISAPSLCDIADELFQSEFSAGAKETEDE